MELIYLRRRTTIKYLVIAALGVTIYCEGLVYFTQPLLWDKLDCELDSKCTKILFIADPQIQGELAVPSPLSLILNWDSDRFLKNTFSMVLRFFKPDVLVYLGDLMDEGSISTRAEFHRYVKRLANIFHVGVPVEQIWLPGDNDIGGENEPIRHDKVTEFNKVYNQSSVISIKNITFYKVNSIMYKVPEKSDVGDQNIKIGVSHYPVTSKGVYGRQVDTAIHADIYFCAHEHTSKYVIQKRNFEFKQTEYQYKDPMLTIDLGSEWLYEIFVPTCSYRMGTSKIGYGAAIVEKRTLRYTVFWSPQRFPLLFGYLLILCILFLFCLCTGRSYSRLRLVRNKDLYFC